MNSYSFTCDCGYIHTFRHIGPQKPDASPLFREVCSDCGQVNYGQLPRPDGKRTRKMQDKTFQKQSAILDIFADLQPRLSVRGIFYQAEARGIVPKTKSGVREIEYQLIKMRREGAIPYNWISDDTRWMIRPIMQQGLKQCLKNTHENYRRDLWAHQDIYVEIWIEKKGLAGVVSPVSEEFGVSLFPAGGYSSITFIYEAAEAIKQIDKPAYVYHFGDFDYYGVEAAEKIKEEFKRHGADIHFERVGITQEQIRKYNLPTRPPQKKTSKELKNWGNKPCVELDALPANILRSLVRKCITQHIEPYSWQQLQAIEQQERATLGTILERLNGDEYY